MLPLGCYASCCDLGIPSHRGRELGFEGSSCIIMTRLKRNITYFLSESIAGCWMCAFRCNKLLLKTVLMAHTNQLGLTALFFLVPRNEEDVEWSSWQNGGGTTGVGIPWVWLLAGILIVQAVLFQWSHGRVNCGVMSTAVNSGL